MRRRRSRTPMLYALCSAAQILSSTAVQSPPAGKQFPLSECLMGQNLRSTMETLPLQILPGDVSEQHLVRNQDVPSLDGGNLVGRDVQRVPKFQSDTRGPSRDIPTFKGACGNFNRVAIHEKSGHRRDDGAIGYIAEPSTLENRPESHAAATMRVVRMAVVSRMEASPGRAERWAVRICVLAPRQNFIPVQNRVS